MSLHSIWTLVRKKTVLPLTLAECVLSPVRKPFREGRGCTKGEREHAGKMRTREEQCSLLHLAGHGVLCSALGDPVFSAESD